MIISSASYLAVPFYYVSHPEFLGMTHNIPGTIISQKKNSKSSVMLNMIVVICAGNVHPSSTGTTKCWHTLASDKWRWRGCGEGGDAENVAACDHSENNVPVCGRLML